MYIDLKEGRMYYKITGQGVPVIFLHGWGMDSSTFDDLAIDGIKKICVDFLGFGKSTLPSCTLYTTDYLYHIYLLVEKLKIKEPIIIGHSFGGRIAIKYSVYFPVKKLILVSSAGIKRRNFKYYKKVYTYKIKKIFYKIFSKKKYKILKETSGSSDYQNASPVMKDILKVVVNEDLRDYLPKIKCPTLILWGTMDDVTPYKDAVIMNTNISSSKLIPFYESKHFCYLSEKDKFSKIIRGFIDD